MRTGPHDQLAGKKGGVLVGEKLRAVRVAKNLSLATVAQQADISVATLSRIERDKQAIEVNLLVRLAAILKTTAHDLLGDGAPAGTTDPLVAKITAMPPPDRARLWRSLAEQRQEANIIRQSRGSAVSDQIEELLAQVDLLRREIEVVRKNVDRKQKR